MFLLEDISWLRIFNLDCDITTTLVLEIVTVPKLRLFFSHKALYFHLVRIGSELIPRLWIFNVNCDITTAWILKIIAIPKFRLHLTQKSLYFHLVTIGSELINIKMVFCNIIGKMFLYKFRFCNSCEGSFVVRLFIYVNWNIFF